MEMRWGFPMAGLHSVSGSQLMVGGRYSLECPAGIGPDLDALVAEVPHRTIPDPVAQARASFLAATDVAWKHLWYVVELGIDAELE